MDNPQAFYALILSPTRELAIQIAEQVEALGSGEDVPSGKNRDIRDMLTLLRNAGIKPEKGRRKDLKKLDSISEDLTMMVQDWK